MPLRDRQNRLISYLRVSVTERCNFRCTYCMPEEGVALSPRAEILSFEEIARVARVASTLGLTKIRLTGGEPTVRRDLPKLIAMLREIPEIREIAMTTNASTLRVLAQPLRDAGLSRLNISLDTLKRERAAKLARRDVLPQVLDGIQAAHEIGIPMKFNAVVMRGENDDELSQLVRFASTRDAVMRFIEWMPMGDVGAHSHGKTVTQREMLQRLQTDFDFAESASTRDNDPARLFVCRESGARVGFISSMSDNFCATCNRMRLTASGGLRPCLHQNAEVDLREILRNGAADSEIARAFQDAANLKWRGHQMTNFIPLLSAKNMVSIGG
jgi:cyclic pyranopterin phosphate synthase